MGQFQIRYLLLWLFAFVTFASVNAEVNQSEINFQDAEGNLSEVYTMTLYNLVSRGEDQKAVALIKEQIVSTGNFDILKSNSIPRLESLEGFQELKDTYLLKADGSAFLYLYVGLVGFFIALVVHFRRKSDRVANSLISAFVFMHSVFLIHVSLYLVNYTYLVPHTQSVSTVFSFLYGPVLYFYFKRVTAGYAFKKLDLLHLIPTLVFIGFFIPIYSQTGHEKLMMMLGNGEYGSHPYLQNVTIFKMISLTVYGIFTLRLYLKNAKEQAANFPKKYRLQRTIMILHSVYALSYIVYGILLIDSLFTDPFIHVQLAAMTAIVLYIGYIAYANPKILSGMYEAISVPVQKYRNSGLTTSFSKELKEQLVALMEKEKLYSQNSIKLEDIAMRLGTTRHNTSQVINEHFGLNFFELINKYRVEEAMMLLKDNSQNLNIIDIAYEVGYNNKVTFNKSFKRFANVTPTQYMRLQATG